MNKKEKKEYSEYKYCYNCSTKSKSERVMCETCGCKLPSRVYKRRIILPFVLAFITLLVFIKFNIIYTTDKAELILCGTGLIILSSRLYWKSFNGGSQGLLLIYLSLIDLIAGVFGMITVLTDGISTRFLREGRTKSYASRKNNKWIMSRSIYVFGMIYVGLISGWLLFCSLNNMVNDKFANIYGIIFCICTFCIPLLMLSFGKFKNITK